METDVFSRAQETEILAIAKAQSNELTYSLYALVPVATEIIDNVKMATRIFGLLHYMRERSANRIEIDELYDMDLLE